MRQVSEFASWRAPRFGSSFREKECIDGQALIKIRLRRLSQSGSVAAFAGLGNADGSHAGGGCGLDAHVGVFEDEAVFGSDAEARGGEEKGVGRGLAVA